MSIVVGEDGCAVHYPSNPSKFVFDAEVSAIFPDMARRSIPMYEEAHRVHARLLGSPSRIPEIALLDIGASRGHFIREVCSRLGIAAGVGRKGVRAVAIDISRDMLDRLSKEMPWVEAHCVAAEDFGTFLSEPVNADAACLFYVLQFIEGREARVAALANAYRHLRPGGVLFLGQKEAIRPARVEADFTDVYYKFRTDNGYTLDEILAKTEALKGSMWVDSRAGLEAMLAQVGFVDVVETTRWLQFATYMARKPL